MVVGCEAMNILHVALGLPPLRTGGLTRYCTELMEAQVQSGDRVSLVFPGRFLPDGVHFCKSAWRGITTYELINPLPVALTYGVAEPGSFIAQCRNANIFDRLLKDVSPDVIHVHSFMGIYREFFQTVKDRSIPMVFTTHDYYPICPRCTLIDSGGNECRCFNSALDCATCCTGGMTLRKSVVMQSNLYASLKSSALLKILSSLVKSRMASGGSASGEIIINEDKIILYSSLLDYNKSIFNLFDLILTNSVIAEQMYRNAFPEAVYRHTSISHAGLSFEGLSARVKRSYENLVIGYFGGQKEYKGFGTILEASRELHNRGIDFELRLYGDEYTNLNIPEAISCGRVLPEDMSRVLRGLDLVVVPSTYRETFGFVVLEALCAGVQVICSDAVGACELIDDDLIFPAGDIEALTNLISIASKEGIASQAIPASYPLSMDEQARQLNDCYEMAKVILSGQK